jgi:hypothetical protein
MPQRYDGRISSALLQAANGGAALVLVLLIYSYYVAEQQNAQAKYSCVTKSSSSNRAKCATLSQTNMFIVLINMSGLDVRPNEFLR